MIKPVAVRARINKAGQSIPANIWKGTFREISAAHLFGNGGRGHISYPPLVSP
jgi:hypothetical protein